MQPPPLLICDDADEPARHVWADPFTDGDTCACGRLYLTLHTDGFAAEVRDTTPRVTRTPDAGTTRRGRRPGEDDLLRGHARES